MDDVAGKLQRRWFYFSSPFHANIRFGTMAHCSLHGLVVFNWSLLVLLLRHLWWVEGLI